MLRIPDNIRHAIRLDRATDPGVSFSELSRRYGLHRRSINRILAEISPAKMEKLPGEEQHRLKKEISQLRRDLAEALEVKVTTKGYEEFVASVAEASKLTKDTRWSRVPTPGRRESVLLSEFSDYHIEEVVSPPVVNWVNGYDLTIAQQRVKNYFNNLCSVAFDDLKGFSFSGVVVTLLGDNITGWIHDELARSNAVAPQKATLLAASWVKAGLRMLLKEFKRVRVVCVIGNHGRGTDKMPHKYPVTSSFDWMIYAMLQESFADNPDIQFQVPESIDAFFRIYKFKFAAEHGNCFRGGSNAISGIYPSISLGNYRKRNAEQAVGNPFDYLMLADKHQLKFLGTVFLNGSGIGYNEYARDNKFGFEKPQQLFVVCHPEHGATVKGEIFVQSPDEPWMAERDARRLEDAA